MVMCKIGCGRGYHDNEQMPAQLVDQRVVDVAV